MDAVEMSVDAKYECLLFDMDDTLYPLSTGLNLACRKNIEEYMINHLHIDEKEVPRMCLELYKEHGTTMAGLKALGFQFDNDEFHEYVHGRLPYENLKPDPVLRNLLLSMPQRKIIFTNADKAHAAKVLSKLGLEDCFEGVICFETLNPLNDNRGDSDHLSLTEAGVEAIDSDDSSEYETDESVSGGCSHIVCKPSPEAFLAAIRLAKVNPQKTIFFDDSVRNVATAKTTGLVTVIVGKGSACTRCGLCTQQHPQHSRSNTRDMGVRKGGSDRASSSRNRSRNSSPCIRIQSRRKQCCISVILVIQIIVIITGIY